MSYVAYSFISFITISLFLYFLLPLKARKYVLLVSSLVFYSFAGLDDFFFVLITMMTTYLGARRLTVISSIKRKKRLLMYIIFFNLGVLLCLKFGGPTLSLIETLIGVEEHLPLSLWMPLGISFYTLQAVSYLVDVYRNKIKAEVNLLKYASYLLYFPTIVQGPITRYKEMKDQIWSAHRFNYKRVKFGGQLMVWGFFKKLVIANHLAIFVDGVFNEYTNYSGSIVLIACIFYSFQIYTDFSGCVDICRGISQMYGIDLMNNFEHPYFAVSIKDFWRRWHISLSSWLRDYVYIPLGGNRKGEIRKYLHILIVFFVSGIWHGVGYHYIVWGLLHGSLQVLSDFFQPMKHKCYQLLHISKENLLIKMFQIVITFMLVTVAWVFFRSPNTKGAIDMLLSIPHSFFSYESLFELGLNQREFKVLLFSLLILLVVSLLQEKIQLREWIEKLPIYIRWPLYLFALYSIIIVGVYGSGYDASAFIYMQF